MGSCCAVCKKKVRLLGFDCSGCAAVHCAAHRLAEDHACPRIEVFRDTSKIQAANPKVVAAKIVKI